MNEVYLNKIFFHDFNNRLPAFYVLDLLLFLIQYEIFRSEKESPALSLSFRDFRNIYCNPEGVFEKNAL